MSGVSKNKKIIVIYKIASSFGLTICSGIEFFPAWTGCEIVMQPQYFLEHGKNVTGRFGWDFLGYQEFANLLLPSDLSDEVGKELEVF